MQSRKGKEKEKGRSLRSSWQASKSLLGKQMKKIIPLNLFHHQFSDPKQGPIILVDSEEQHRRHRRCQGERQDSRGRY